VILFWATWCQPCVQELPFYESLYQRYRSQGLKIVAISMDSQATVMRAGPAARRLGVTYDVVTDVDTRVTTQLNTRRAAPFSIWIDRSGRIVRESEGFSPAEQNALAQGIADLVRRCDAPTDPPSLPSTRPPEPSQRSRRASSRADRARRARLQAPALAPGASPAALGARRPPDDLRWNVPGPSPNVP